MNSAFTTATPDDFITFKVDGIHSTSESLRRAYNGYKRGVSSICVKKDKDILAIVSLRLPYPLMLEASSLVGENAAKHPITYIKSLRYLINNIFTNDKLNRIQIYTKDTGQYRKWGHLLGMKLEAKLEKYGVDSTTHLLFAKVRED